MTARAAAVLVFAVTAACFLPALLGGFLDWDDADLLTRHAAFLSHGWRDPGWMLADTTMSVWQPLSWLSYGLDYAVWGLRPLGFHLTNVLLHAANAAVFFFVSLRLLGRDVRASAASALFFSLHPLRVESVAWIAERRDVLSAFFLLLSLLAYLKEKRAASVAAYAACLLAKPFAVAYPLLLPMLDRWVLKRPIRWGGAVPCLALAAAAGAAAAWTQAGGGSLPVSIYGWTPRLCTAAFGPGFYLLKTAFPAGLSPMYELSRLTHPGLFAVCALATVISGRAAWSRPATRAAWLWFVLIPLPVLGLLKTAEFAAADRYTYLAALPCALLFGAVWRRWKAARPAAALLLLGLAVLTWRQAGFWKDDVTLWSHAAAVAPGSTFAHEDLAAALEGAGRRVEAARERALAASSSAADLHERGARAFAAGDYAAAAEAFGEAAEVAPYLPSTQNDLGLSLARLGDRAGAAARFSFALRLDPGFAAARGNLAAVEGTR